MTNPYFDQNLSQFVNRPTLIEVNKSALIGNLGVIRGLIGGVKVLASIKANGYGHGLLNVAQIFQDAGVDALGVAYIEEAIELRRSHINLPILVFGGLMREQLALYLQYDVDVTASSVSKMEQIDEAARRFGKRARVHLKIDTGLERIGVHHYSAQPLFEAALKAEWCDIVGVYSHLAQVQGPDFTIANKQLERFAEALSYFQPRAKAPFLRHIANSGGVLEVPASHLDMVRPGLALYGVYPNVKLRVEVGLKPSLALKSRVVFFKVVKSGAGVSYDHAWIAKQDTRVITVPIGYGDGYLRALSNRGEVLIRGRRYPIIGKICMDQLMVDISPVGEGYNNDEVVLIGTQGDQSILVEEIAALINTTPHEILVLLNQRIPRVIV